jgi:PhnB protein
MKAVIPYLIFDGNCREAIEFHANSLGAELTITPYSDMPGDVSKHMDDAKNRIMHARLTKGQVLLMASDNMPGMPFQQGNNFNVSVDCESLDEIKTFFGAMSEGGTVTMPLQDQFWGAHFGMLKDKFGIHWMFNFDYPK